ncbi:hypothetical protein EIP91_003842 [Steccherinum ochraceum]|uniref:DUF6533 domain-containing protein n=1 Tax=Steccherinum ochraceum TaxID=92696 RepID=A0A4R0R9V6_9APHY|nr:hypothetical protein EIP91_003842 [Steccherinum ochraceum]
MDLDPQQYAALVASKMGEMYTANFCAVAAATLLFYDFFLTLGDEIKCVWKGKFSGVTVLFVLNRYVTIVYRALMLIQLMPWNTNALTEAQADTVDIDSFSIFNRVFAMTADAIILILTWIRTAGIMRTFKLKVKTSLGLMLLRDGTIFFVFLLTLNAINLVAIKAQRFGAVPAISDVVTSILISRFLLNLRGVYVVNEIVTSSSFHPSRMSDVRFADSITGNLGAPLVFAKPRARGAEDDDDEREEIFARDPILVGIPHHLEPGGTDVLPILAAHNQHGRNRTESTTLDDNTVNTFEVHKSEDEDDRSDDGSRFRGFELV